jgi:energy-coupling factor transport system ATP-binding protein
MLAHRPRVWLLDEPTRGADVAAHRLLACILKEHAAGGGAAIVATHDIESAARWATRVVALDHGRVAFDLPVREALGHGGPLPTQVARFVPGALTFDEVEPC